LPRRIAQHRASFQDHEHGQEHGAAAESHGMSEGQAWADNLRFSAKTCKLAHKKAIFLGGCQAFDSQI
jgi:hypothetical protein